MTGSAPPESSLRRAPDPAYARRVIGLGVAAALLARELGMGAEERKVTVEEWESAVRSGRMTEAFACGTAAVITPIGRVKSRHGEFAIHGGETGPVATRLRKALLDIQQGAAPDTHGWMHTVVEGRAR